MQGLDLRQTRFLGSEATLFSQKRAYQRLNPVHAASPVLRKWNTTRTGWARIIRVSISLKPTLPCARPVAAERRSVKPGLTPSPGFTVRRRRHFRLVKIQRAGIHQSVLRLGAAVHRHHVEASRRLCHLAVKGEQVEHRRRHALRPAIRTRSPEGTRRAVTPPRPMAARGRSSCVSTTRIVPIGPKKMPPRSVTWTARSRPPRCSSITSTGRSNRN